MNRIRCLVCLLLGLMPATALAGKQDSRLDIYWVDVEGGAATLIVTPSDESILIDTGNPGRRDANRIQKVVGEVAGLKTIDHLIVTHYHSDHYGGAEVLSSILPIRNVYDNGTFDQMPDNPGKAYFTFRCSNRTVIQPGDIIPLRQNVESHARLEMMCLGTRKTFVDPKSVDAKSNQALSNLHRPKDRDGSDNANSVVMLVRFGEFQFFDAGDLTWNQENRLVNPFNLVGEVDVYQVTHHGLDSSNNPIVLSSLRPKVAIMNNGDRKGCLPEVFTNLKECESINAIYQVHKNLRPDGKTFNAPDEFIANHSRRNQCKANYIKLSVAADGSNYTVAIPANSHIATYQTK